MELSEWFADMACSLVSSGEVADALKETYQLAVAVIDCAFASVSQLQRMSGWRL